MYHLRESPYRMQEKRGYTVQEFQENLDSW